MNLATTKQIIANRQNALKGGVKTTEGKEISRYNAIRHGILRKLFIPREAEEAETIHKQLLLEFEPETLIEELLIEMMTMVYIRRQRVYEAEMSSVGNSYDDKPTRYLVSCERQFYHALHELQRIQAIRKGFRPTSVAFDIIGGNTGE